MPGENWDSWVHAALVDLTAALTGPDAGRLGHLMAAMGNINRAIDELEPPAEEERNAG